MTREYETIAALWQSFHELMRGHHDAENESVAADAEPVAEAEDAPDVVAKSSEDAYVTQFEVAAAVAVYGTVLIAPSDSAGCEYDVVVPSERV